MLFRSYRENAERSHLHDTRGVVCSRRLYQLFSFLPDGRVTGFVSSFSIARSLVRENALQVVYCIARIISAAVSPDTDDDEKDDDDDDDDAVTEGGERQHLLSTTRNYRAPSDVYLIRCDVIYIATSRIYNA